jgi:ADP-Ribosyltransferase in polyvalent proteins
VPELVRRPELPSTSLPDGATSIEVDGRARPVHNSHGLLIHWSQEGQRNFWRWFGDSIAVDGQGRPMVVHHGTQAEDNFDAFWPGHPVYVTESPEYAANWASNNKVQCDDRWIPPRSRIMPLYIRVTAARDMSDGKDSFEPEHDPQFVFYDVLDEDTGAVTYRASDAIKKLQQEGCDAVVWLEWFQFKNWTVIDPRQVKSALNSGLFDPSSDLLSDPIDGHRMALDHLAITAVADRFEMPEKAVEELLTMPMEQLSQRYWTDVTPAYMGAPVTRVNMPMGSARVMSVGSDEREFYVEYLRRFDAAELRPVEHEENIRNHPSFADYRTWSAQGIQPPYINVVEADDGGFNSLNRRRTLVAQELGQDLDGWLNPLNRETGLPLKLGDIRAAMEAVLSRDAAVSTPQPEMPQSPLNGALTLVVDGRERPALNSQGQPLHWSEEGVSNFWRWFGDSKVVDAEGRPLVVYHGTVADFEAFDNSKTGANDGGLWGRGHYFSTVAGNANSYALRQGDGARVMPIYVKASNPLVLRTSKDLVTRLPDGSNYKDLVGDNLDGSKIKRLAQAGEHDGVIQIKPDGVIGDLVAYEPKQMKSAIGNSGLFDPTSDHLSDPTGRLELTASMQRDLEGSNSMNSAPENTENNDRTDSIVLVEPGQLGSFEKRLAALNKKAVAFGLEPIKVLASKDVVYERKIEYVGRDMDKQLSYLKPVPEGRQSDAPVMLKRIEIEYPEIKLGNWRVVGKVEAAEGGNLTFGVTRDPADEAALSAMAAHPITCDHCKTNRNRKDGFLLRDNDSGAYRQVGSNCLEDFTGLDPAAALFLARMHEVVRIAEGDLGDYADSGRVNAVSTRRYLADVSYITENHGFVSSAKAKETYANATFDEALALPRKLEESWSLRTNYAEQIERHLAKADAVRAWIASKPEEGSFDRNVKLLLAADAIAMERKHLAFAAAAVPMYSRMLAMEAQARIPSMHVGSPGQKMNAVLSVDRVVPIESQYGTSHLVLMRDQEGNRIKWKTSACPDEIRNAGAGRSMEAAFKVKGHDEYKGVAQTSVTHLKVSRWLDLDQSAEFDDAADHEPPAVLYRTSIYWHPGDRPRDFSKPVIDSSPLTAQQLVAEAQDRGIDQLRGEDEFVWYGSEPNAQGESFSLHVLDVDGQEPTTQAYQQITEMLKAQPPLHLEASTEHSAHSL